MCDAGKCLMELNLPGSSRCITANHTLHVAPFLLQILISCIKKADSITVFLVLSPDNLYM